LGDLFGLECYCEEPRGPQSWVKTWGASKNKKKQKEEVSATCSQQVQNNRLVWNAQEMGVFRIGENGNKNKKKKKLAEDTHKGGREDRRPVQPDKSWGKKKSKRKARKKKGEGGKRL